MSEELERKKFYFPNGKLQAERCYKNGLPHGCHREWHENGVLASKVYYHNGIPDGTGKQWDKEGHLICSYNISNGTGIQKVWFENQGIWAEISWRNGKMTGRQRTYWIKEGTVAGDTFWIENENVSQKKYNKACKENPELPRYVIEPEEITEAERHKSTKDIKVDSKSHFCLKESFVLGLISSGNACEATSWLMESDIPERSLGEAQGKKNSLLFVKSLYEQGAKKVWVFDNDGNLNDQQNLGCLIIELPNNPDERHKLLVKCAEICEEQGFDAELDVGQKYTLLMLD